MKILIDLQPCQGESSFRGIGRYSMSLAKAIVRNRKDNEIYLLLNGAFIDSIELIKKEFKELLPAKNIITFFIPTPVAQMNLENIWRSKVGELIREYAILNIKPDIVHISSLFEGFVDDIVTSIGQFSNDIPTSVTLYDLIPLINKRYLESHPSFKKWYFKKIDFLKKANLLLAISESSKKEAVEYLNINEDKIINISAAVDEKFRTISMSDDLRDKIFHKYNIEKPFMMYAPSGFDQRKNIDRLIDAFSKLPKGIKENYQLVITSKIPDGNKKDLEDKIVKAGLTKNNIVITGYVPNDELIAMYNLCELFILPSLHEGFGLPALEAMACGAPVIGSNTTSIPEVIGREDALFDPYSVESIANKIKEVLTNDNFRNELIEYAIKRAKEFSWDKSAKIAIEAFENLYKNIFALKTANYHHIENKKPKLAYVSPLPPERSGISTYSAELLPYLAKHYDIEIIVDQEKVTDEWISKNLPIRDVEYFKTNVNSYDRILYHMGNSPFHKHMLSLLEYYPGVVALHDFYLSHLINWINHMQDSSFLFKELYRSQGYSALKFLKEEGIEETIWKYPSNLNILQNARGIIVHSEFSKKLAKEFYSKVNFDNWYVIHQLRRLSEKLDKAECRKRLGISEKDFLICSFGLLGSTKQNHRVLGAFIKSSLAKLDNVKLVFVGENHGGEYGQNLLDTIKQNNLKNKVTITGWTDDEAYRLYLSSCDMGVQLRTNSRGETSRAALDCMAYGIPTIVNANGSMAELSKDAVYMLEDDFKDKDLLKAMEDLYLDKDKRGKISSNAKNYIEKHCSPEEIAIKYKEAIENTYKIPGEIELIQKISQHIDISLDDENLEIELTNIANSISKNANPNPRLKQLFVGVSAISRTDLRTGIERVVRAQLVELLNNPPNGFRVEPIYLSDEGGYWHYRYARRFTSNILGLENVNLDDETIDYYEGDIFYAPDLYYPVIKAHKAGLYKQMRAKNVSINFLVHDILPILRPDCFPEGAQSTHAQWVDAISSVADRLICVSNSVAEELKSYLTANDKLRKDLQIIYIHNGADIERSLPTNGSPQDYQRILDLLRSKLNFLMVGTIEPRKGHLQTIKAFDILWQNGYDVNLIIVGKEGWLHLPDSARRTIPEIIKTIKNHPELNNRLFWLSGISDEYLEKIYESSNCFIMASEGEGFGLPLIEAAKHKLPIIARDIPVYKEVASDYAYYFINDTDPQTLVKAIEEWLNLYKENKHPKSDGMQYLNWKENVKRLLEVILEGE